MRYRHHFDMIARHGAKDESNDATLRRESLDNAATTSADFFGRMLTIAYTAIYR